MNHPPDSVTLVPVHRIQVLNSRERNQKVFEDIVENIRTIGLKKPITVTQRQGEAGAEPTYLLVCGEGRLNAFRILGQTHIPAMVVEVSDEDAFIMSLAENIARRGHRPLEILADVDVLRSRGYDADTIIQKTGLSQKYVKRLIEQRPAPDAAGTAVAQIRPPTTSYSLVRTYQNEVERQRKMVLKAEHAHQRLLLVIQGLKKLLADPNFVNLLRAEGLDTLPNCLSDRISALNGATA